MIARARADRAIVSKDKKAMIAGPRVPTDVAKGFGRRLKDLRAAGGEWWWWFSRALISNFQGSHLIVADMSLSNHSI